MAKFRHYITSFRLRTLPLSVSGIIMGTFIAFSEGNFSLQIFLWAIATTLALQILSNLANELGDIKKGTDNLQRLGPIRSLQKGNLSEKDIVRVIYIFVGLSVFFGLGLIYSAWYTFSVNWLIFVLLGIASILSALFYTLGRNAYGYYGLGDIFVFIFFGLVSTLGSYFLMSNKIDLMLLFPSFSIGCLSVAVLNLNNMRDIENDKICNKRTIPVKIGLRNAKIYHFFLITSALVCIVFYDLQRGLGFWGYLFIVSVPLFYKHLSQVLKSSGRDLDKQMPKLSLSTLFFTFLVSIGFLLEKL